MVFFTKTLTELILKFSLSFIKMSEMSHEIWTFFMSATLFSIIANFSIIGSQKPNPHNLLLLKLTWFMFLQTLPYVLIQK